MNDYSVHLHPRKPFHHNEWTDSPESSPSRKLHHSYPTIINGYMSATQTTYETPVKSKHYTYVTPVSDRVDKKSEDDYLDKLITVTPQTHNVKTWDIFWAMLNNITGKDKMAKLAQYVLRLLLHHASKTQSYLSDDTINISVINSRYNNNEKKLNLLRNFIKHPQDFIRVVLILVASVFQQKMSGMAKGLGTYRQFLRFGKSPFRIRTLYKRLQANYDAKNGTIHKNFFSNENLGEAVGLYYNINDEATLLYKLGVLLYKPLHRIVSRHESLAWYCDSWLALYNAFVSLQQLSQQEIDLTIQIQVKKKSRQLSKQLLGGSSLRIQDSPAPEDSAEQATIREIKFKKHNAYLDIYKTVSDIIFNSYTVFNLALPFDTIQIWTGISAAGLSTIKLYRETKKKLIEADLKKRA